MLGGKCYVVSHSCCCDSSVEVRKTWWIFRDLEIWSLGWIPGRPQSPPRTMVDHEVRQLFPCKISVALYDWQSYQSGLIRHYRHQYRRTACRNPDQIAAKRVQQNPRHDCLPKQLKFDQLVITKYARGYFRTTVPQKKSQFGTWPNLVFLDRSQTNLSWHTSILIVPKWNRS